MTDIFKLNDLQLDALKEFGSIGSGNAATVLSQLLCRRVEMTIPEIEIVRVEEVAKVMGDEEKLVAGVYFRIYGNATGSILFTFPREDALSLVNLLLPENKEERTIFTPLGESALKEAGNIIAGAYITALSGLLGKTLILSVPQLAIDMLGSIIDFIQIEISAVADYVLVMQIEFKEERGSVRGHFFILPNQEFLNMMLNAIGPENEN